MQKKIIIIFTFCILSMMTLGKIVYFGEIKNENIKINEYNDLSELEIKIRDITRDVKDEYETDEEYKNRIFEKTEKLNKEEFMIECNNEYSYNTKNQEYIFKIDFENFGKIIGKIPPKNEILLPFDIQTAKKYRNDKIRTGIIIKEVLPEIEVDRNFDGNNNGVKINNMAELNVLKDEKIISHEKGIIDAFKNKKISYKMVKIIFYIEKTNEEIAEIGDFEITEEDTLTTIVKGIKGYITEKGILITNKENERKKITKLQLTSIPLIYKCYDKENKKYFLQNVNGENIGGEFDDIIEIPLAGGVDGEYSNKNILVIKEGNKYGLIDKKGKIVLDIEYEGIHVIEYSSGSGGTWYDSNLMIKKDGKMGLIDKNGKILIEPKYEFLNLKDYNQVKNNINQEEVDGENNEEETTNGEVIVEDGITESAIEEEMEISEGATGTEEAITEAITDVEETNTEEMIPKYEFADNEYPDSDLVIKSGEQYGIAKLEEGIYFPKDNSYNMVFDGNKNYMIVGNVILEEQKSEEAESKIIIKSAKCGVVKSNGEFLFKIGTYNMKRGENGIEIKDVKLFGEMLQATFQGKKNIYGEDGKIIYSNAEIIEGEKEYIIKQNGKYGIIDKSGKIIEPINHIKIEECQSILNKNNDKLFGESEKIETIEKEEYKIFEKAGKYGIKTGKGKEVLNAMFNSIEEKNGAFIVNKNNKNGILNQRSWETIYYEKLNSGIFNMFFIQIGNRMGVINQFGDFVLEPVQFYEYMIMTEKTVFVKNGSGRWFPTSKNGDNKIGKEYTELIKKVKLNNGEEMREYELGENNNEIENLENRIVVKGTNYKYGLLTSDGEELYDCQADKIEREYIENECEKYSFDKRIPLFKIYKGEKYTYVDNNGKSLGNIINGVDSFSKEYKLPKFINLQCLDKDAVITYSYYPNIGKIKAGISNKNGEIIASPMFDEIQFYPEYAVLTTGDFKVCVDYKEPAIKNITMESATTASAMAE